MANRRDEILAHIPDIPSLPTSAVEVIRLVQSPNSSMTEIMSAIEYDPALTAEVLRLANSAYFAGPRTIATLREAGVLFGTARLMQVVLAAAVFPLARRPLKGYDLEPGRLLEHLAAVAIGSEELASALGEVTPRYTFTAGLLHDVGKLVLGTFVEVDAGPILRLAHQEQVTFDEAERAVLGIDHAEVGAELLRRWNLPEEIVEAVRWHQEPDERGAENLVVDLVHVADMLSVENGLGVGIDGLHYRPSEVVAARRQLNATMLERVSCVMLAEFQQLTQTQAAGG